MNTRAVERRKDPISSEEEDLGVACEMFYNRSWEQAMFEMEVS